MNKLLCASMLAVAGLSLATPAWSMTVTAPPQAAHSGVILAAADAAQGARDFIDHMARSGIDFLGNKNLSDAQRKAEFRKLLTTNYDMQTIGRFALGTYWRTATPAQQAQYQGLFQNMIIDVYSRRFADYKGQQLVVKSAQAQEGTPDIIVNSQIVSDHAEPVNVDWRVRNKGGQYKVVDVIVEGVSMALTQRSDFASVIQQGGGDVSVLINALKSGALAKKQGDKQASK